MLVTSDGTAVARHRERSLTSDPKGPLARLLSAHPGRHARVWPRL